MRAQLGIPRPRKTKVDGDLRNAILDALQQLQGSRTQDALADDLGVSAKTLSRYRTVKSATLGGDVLFRICELCHKDDRGVRVTCRGRTLLVLDEHLQGGPASRTHEQLRFAFAGTIDVNVSIRKGVMRVEKMELEPESKTG